MTQQVLQLIEAAEIALQQLKQSNARSETEPHTEAIEVLSLAIQMAKGES